MAHLTLGPNLQSIRDDAVTDLEKFATLCKARKQLVHKCFIGSHGDFGECTVIFGIWFRCFKYISLKTGHRKSHIILIQFKLNF